MLTAKPQTKNDRWWFLRGWTWAVLTAEEYSLTSEDARLIAAHGERLCNEAAAEFPDASSGSGGR